MIVQRTLPLFPRLGLALLVVLSGCSTVRVARREGTARTCVVMAGHGEKGLANLGALRALQRAQVPVECVVGSDMGALAGALYASDPGERTDERFSRFVRTYDAATASAGVKASTVESAMVVGMFSHLAPAGSGMLPDMAGQLAASARTEPLDAARFVRALDIFLAHRTLGQLAVPLVAPAQAGTGADAAAEPGATGSVADAVGRSVDKPWMFHPTGDVVDAPQPVPPVETACRLFPDASLVVINVTGQPLPPAGAGRCPVLEVKVTVGRPQLEVAFDPREVYVNAVRAGDDTTERVLDNQVWTAAGGTAEPVKN